MRKNIYIGLASYKTSKVEEKNISTLMKLTPELEIETKMPYLGLISQNSQMAHQPSNKCISNLNKLNVAYRFDL